MQRYLNIVILLLAFSAVTAHAQRRPPIEGVQPPRIQLEALAGYSAMNSRIVSSGAPLNMNGFQAAAAFNINTWLAVIGEFGIYHQGNVAQSGDSLTVSSIQFGPRIRLPGRGRFAPFAQALFGVGHAGGSLYTKSLTPGQAPLGPNDSPLVTVGGGLDVKLSPGFALRAIQADYVHSDFLNGTDNRQNYFSIGAGVILSFGYYH